jgi:hypothetical protein
MHVPMLSTSAHFAAYPDSAPADDEGRLTWFLNSERAISIFRGKDFATPQEDMDVVYGYGEMPAYVGGTWQTLPNNMGEGALWGTAGFNNPTNNYTWTMSVYQNRLWVGTMDWSWLVADAVKSAIGSGIIPEDILPSLPILGADLWYFPNHNSPAFPESIAGVGNPSSYGIRTVVSDDTGLYLGMANPMNLLTDSAVGPLGGWELIKLETKTPNTPAGGEVTVPLQDGASITFCHVDAAGHTVSLALPQDYLTVPLPNGQSLSAAMFIGSTADWRNGCPSSRRATVTYPIGSAVNPRMFQLVWDPKSQEHEWVDITGNASGSNITGIISGDFLGVIAIVSMPSDTGVAIPALSWTLLTLLAATVLGIGTWVAGRRKSQYRV